MATFTIDSENNIAAHAGIPAGADNLQSFATEKELAKLTAEWPGTRLVDIWNSFAGVAPFDDLKPVKKFTNRKAAVARIWAAVQRLSADGAQPAADVAPAKGKAKKSPAKGPRRARAQKGATESRRQQESGGDRDDEARQGRDAGRDRGSHGLAEAHGTGLRQHPGQQGRREDRILEERRRGANLSHRQVSKRRSVPFENAAFGSEPGRRSCFQGSRFREVSDVTDRSRH